MVRFMKDKTNSRVRATCVHVLLHTAPDAYTHFRKDGAILNTLVSSGSRRRLQTCQTRRQALHWRIDDCRLRKTRTNMRDPREAPHRGGAPRTLD